MKFFDVFGPAKTFSTVRKLWKLPPGCSVTHGVMSGHIATTANLSTVGCADAVGPAAAHDGCVDESS